MPQKCRFRFRGVCQSRTVGIPTSKRGQKASAPSYKRPFSPTPLRALESLADIVMKIIIIKEGGEQLPLPSTFLAILVLSRNKRHIMECVKQVFTSNDPSWVDGAFFVRPLLGHWHICADALRHGVSYPTALLQAYLSQRSRRGPGPCPRQR